MQAAQVLAGYSLGGADLLRRAMGKKIQAEMDKQMEMFVSGAAEHNKVPHAKSEQIFEQIAKFAGYGFNKSHAAAYALIAYWTAYMKCHHPKAFMAASMTLDLGNTDKLAVFKQDMDKMKLDLLPPDVNRSHVTFSVQGQGVRYALGALKGVGEGAMEGLVNEREKGGPYQSVEDYAQRLDPKSMNKRQLEQLAAAGAFDTLHDHRAQLAGGSELILRHAHSLKEEKEAGQVNLFADINEGGLGMPDLPQVDRWSSLDQLAAEFAAIGFYLSAHPLDTRQGQFSALGISTLASIEDALLDKPAGRFQVAGVLLKKQERMSQKGSKFAFLQLSDPTGVYEVMLFSEMLSTSREFLEPGARLLLSVEAEQKEDQIRFTCQKVEPLDLALEHRVKQVEIALENAESLPEIKRLLGSRGAGPVRVCFSVPVDARRIARIDLSGRYAVPEDVRESMRQLRGVDKVFET